MLAMIMAIEDDKDRHKAEQLYLTYRNIMFYAAKRILKDDARSEDALQNAFEGIIKNLDAVAEIDSIRTKSYVIRAAKNSAISLYRKDSRFVSFDEEFAVSELEMFQSMDIDDDVRNLMEAIYQIPQIYRDVLILKSLHGYSNREIAAAYRVSESVIRKRMERAKAKLNQILEGR
ncbi:RNA polymerase sigma factor [Anaerostipes sp.]|uniref:RNA polymerase sigma factor n=1 Tax=Anaerostipes sp. TaxID=1872530 RepID=UPI0025B94246|nr:RNA polymerase sigma factor [Anaerostipes sp.]MBS7008039.1 RNA polymerase sigma factor [Anaerostipes sp.]